MALRLASSAGEALPAEIGERFKAHFGVDIVDGIGSTEMLHIFLSNLPGDVRYGTTGWPVPGYIVELRGEDGGPVPDGEPGDLYIQGPSAAMMYWGNREKTRDTFQGGWTKSGDKYIRNADGTYTYGGRSDDMLKVSGIYVSPFEVEATLVQHPAVLEAAVIGKEDTDGLTKTKAFVVLKDGAQATEAELKAFVKDRLAPYKYPRLIRIRRRAAEDGHRQDPALQAARARAGRRGVSTPGRPEGEQHSAQRDDILTNSAFVDIAWQGQRVAIEHAWFGRPRDDRTAPLIVFLHEGLGSVSTWRDFPAELCDALGARGLVYSRPGYGRSGSLTPEAAWAPDFMHRQAERAAAGAAGGTGHRCPARPALALWPQRRRFDRAALRRAIPGPAGRRHRARAAHHGRGPVGGQHRGRARRLRGHRPARAPGPPPRRPGLAPSGAGTASGSTRPSASGRSRRSLRRSAARCWRCRAWTTSTAPWRRSTASRARLPQTELLELADCRHAPQRDQPEAVIAAVQAFMGRHGR